MYVKSNLVVAYGLVGLGLFYSLAVDSSELFLAMTTVIYVLMLPLAYLVSKVIAQETANSQST